MSPVIAAVAGALDRSVRDWVSDATAHSRFAGPDGDAVAVGVRCALGHAALDTGAPSAPQPLTLDGRTWISADVRLDDRGGLVRALGAAGPASAAEADDASLVLLAYARWGDRFVEHLAGEFAFAVWDGRRGRLLCARDQIGVIPLHYAMAGDHLMVSSALDALLLHPGVPDELDEVAIAELLVTNRAAGFDATAFAAIRRLAPACLLTWEAGRVHITRYWTQPVYEPLLRRRRPAGYVAQFRHRLEVAVAERATGARVAVHLSGGLDSPTVAALARDGLGARGLPADAVRGVTSILGGASGDQEGDYAGVVARALGIHHVVIDESGLDPRDPTEAPELLTPEPTPYRWTDLEHRLALAAAEHGRVCLTGLGGDPLLSHVPWWWGRWLADGHPLRLGVALVDHARLFGERPRPYLRESAARLWRTRVAPIPAPPRWINHELAVRVGVAERFRPLTARAAWTWDQQSLSRDPLWQMLFTWGDPTFTRIPMRYRHPFTDLRLLELVAQLPSHPWFVDKRLLRDAAGDLLPAAVATRPKTALVPAPRPGMDPQTRRRLVELVRGTPGARRFIDPVTLTEMLVSPPPSQPGLVLGPPLGLVFWLAHWRRPRDVPGPPPQRIENDID